MVGGSRGTALYASSTAAEESCGVCWELEPPPVNHHSVREAMKERGIETIQSDLHFSYSSDYVKDKFNKKEGWGVGVFLRVL